MRRVDEQPLDPEVAETLDAIDATLAGEPVDPRFAEIAELALLLTADRPQPAPAFAASLDQRVARRFAPDPAAGPPRRRRTRWAVAPAWGGGIVRPRPRLCSSSRSCSWAVAGRPRLREQRRRVLGRDERIRVVRARPGVRHGAPGLLPASPAARKAVPSVGSVKGTPAQSLPFSAQSANGAMSSASAPSPPPPRHPRPAAARSSSPRSCR